ncbi:MAG: radical SAM protein [Planctomycetota bacterium]
MRILLVALSGVRVCDEELMRLGLTLPGFVERSKVIASLPSLGLLTLAGMTADRHEVVYREADQLDADNLPHGFDLVAVSTFTAQAPEAYALADRFRALGSLVVIGGLHATAVPDEAGEHADAVIVGEGEPVWPEVLADAEAGCLKPRYDARGREFDFVHSPMPRFDLLDLERYNRITVQATRGCPWRCDFCASSIRLTPRYKTKPVERVLAEIDAVIERWPRPFLEFADDNSFAARGYWKRLLPELAKRPVRWFTETDISVAQDEELLRLMAEAGCAQVLIGLESPNASGLDGIELRNNWKLQQLDGYAAAIRRIQSFGIRVNGCFVVGLDGHTPDIFNAVLQTSRDYGLFDVQVTLPTPFPGTPFYDRLKAAGRLTHDGQWERCTLFDLNFIPNPMSPDELVNGFHALVTELYSEAETRARRERFKAHRRLGGAEGCAA